MRTLAQESSTQCPLMLSLDDELPLVYHLNALTCDVTLSGCESGNIVQANGTVFVSNWVMSSTPTNQTISVDSCIQSGTNVSTSHTEIIVMAVFFALVLVLLALIGGMIGRYIYRRRQQRRRRLLEGAEIPDLSTNSISLQSTL